MRPFGTVLLLLCALLLNGCDLNCTLESPCTIKTIDHIGLYPDTLLVPVGDTRSISAQFYDKAGTRLSPLFGPVIVRYSSSAPDIASILHDSTSGYADVKGLAVGQATITASWNSKTASGLVIVGPPPTTY